MAEQELSPIAVVTALACFFGGIAIGLSTGGLMGGLAGGVLGAVIPATIIGLQKLRRANRSLQADAVPTVQGLAPRQALTVLAAAAAQGRDGTAAPAFQSELLDDLRAAAELAEHDPSKALEQVRALVEAHPRSPAAKAELARRLLAVDQPGAAWAALSEALARALDGGMNPMAANLIEEFPHAREHLVLSAAHAGRLAKVLHARGLTDAAQWARTCADP